MNINIIGTGLFKSGGMRIIFEYANRLTRNGHNVIYYYPIKQYYFNKESCYRKIKRYYGALKHYFLYKNEIKSFYKIKCELKFVPFISNIFIRDADIIFATQWPTAYDVNSLNITKGKKFYFLQDYEIWESDKSKVDNALSLNLTKITISNYNKVFFKETFNVDTHVILNGIDFDLYNNENKNYSNRKKVITFIEHHLDSKGVDNAIYVIEKLNSIYSDIEFLCFGQHKYHKIPDFVKFYQNLSDEDIVKYVYNVTDIFIYPSIKEGFALPPAEAMACKCAVVTTTVGAVPEYSIHNETAIHVKPDDPEDLFNSVNRLIQNDKEIMRLSENAYIGIRNSLKWNDSVLKMEQLFRESI